MPTTHLPVIPLESYRPGRQLTARERQIIEDITRREFIAAGVALGAVVAAGCSDDDSRSEPAARQTRTIETMSGPVEVPVNPTRIVALEAYMTLQLLDELGAPLVAAATLGGDVRTNVSSETAALPSIGFDVNLEQVAAAAPDLIIGRYIDAAIYEQLSAIAPTVDINQGDDVIWAEHMRALADVVGMRPELDSMLSRVDDRIVDLNAAIVQRWPTGVTVSVLRVYEGGEFRAYSTLGRFNTSPEILSRLDDVTVVADVLAPTELLVDLSSERLADVDADVILYYVGGGAQADTEVDAVEAELRDNPIWQQLSAVSNGRAHRVEAGDWFNVGNVASANRVIDDLFAYVAQA